MAPRFSYDTKNFHQNRDFFKKALLFSIKSTRFIQKKMGVKQYSPAPLLTQDQGHLKRYSDA